MQVVYTNANHEFEMVYVEILGAVIIANLLEGVQTIQLTVLDMQFHNGCAVSPAGFEVQMFQFFLQECSLIQQIIQTCLIF